MFHAPAVSALSFRDLPLEEAQDISIVKLDVVDQVAVFVDLQLGAIKKEVFVLEVFMASFLKKVGELGASRYLEIVDCRAANLPLNRALFFPRPFLIPVFLSFSLFLHDSSPFALDSL